ncbi:DMT family transporter [Sphingomonas sp.]|uniref:DMT family transporter n=1 Tax=Sphingomonas sp. TaxID=28214 RepID=UPI0028A6507D|nr:DMT family transporter [Sphingomonas sp.]
MSRSPRLAFLVAALGIANYSVMDAVMKGMSIAHGAYSAVLWRSVGAIVLLGPIFLLRRTPWPRPQALKLHFARGVLAGTSVVLFFWGLARVTMAQGIALTFLAPLIAMFLAAAFLGERIRRAAIGGSLVASLGVLTIAAGQAQAHASTEVVLGSIAVFAASILYAGSLILLRQQAQIADPIEVALFTSLVLALVMLPGAPWFSAMPSVSLWPWILGAALVGSISAVLLAWAYGHAEAQVLAPVEYTAFVWAALLGYVVFDERVSGWTVAGALLIILGCLAAIRGRVAPAPQTEAAA